jgi:hypothetical protein
MATLIPLFIAPILGYPMAKLSNTPLSSSHIRRGPSVGIVPILV